MRCIVSGTPFDVASVVLGCFWSNLYCACAETAISQLPVKIMTSPLNSATALSKKRAIIWRSHDVFTFFHCIIANLPHFYFRSIWPNDLEHVLLVVLRTAKILTKSEVGQTICSWLIPFLLLIRYVTLWPWPLTLWPWALVVYRLSRGLNSLPNLSEVNNPRPSYSDFQIKNLGAVRHLGFDRTRPSG